MSDIEVRSKPKRSEHKENLREQAKTRTEAWDKLTTMQKIESLDRRLGPNVGAKKQRAKLKTLLEKEHAAKEAEKLAKKAKAKPEKPAKTRKSSKSS